MVVDQVLELRRPGIEVLHFIQKQKRRFVALRCLVERAAQDLVLEPASDRQRGFSQTGDRGQLVEGDVEQARGGYPVFEQ